MFSFLSHSHFEHLDSSSSSEEGLFHDHTSSLRCIAVKKSFKKSITCSRSNNVCLGAGGGEVLSWE